MARTDTSCRKKVVKSEDNDEKQLKNPKKPSIIGLKQDFEDMLKKSFERTCDFGPGFLNTRTTDAR